jgi:hypothetical protein
MSRRVLAAATALATIAVWAAATSAPPAAAAVTGYEEVSGDIIGDGREEVFTYNAGDLLDGLTSFGNGGVPGGELTFEFCDYQVTGLYDPIAGNFDGDAHDEIFWYAPGSGQDSVWSFPSCGTRTTRPYQVTGTFEPVAGDFDGDGVDDIFWYAPGSADDHIWFFDANGNYTSVPYQVSGTFIPLAGSFGSDQTDDVFWYAAGTARDHLWDLHPDRSYTSTDRYQVTGTYRPFVLDIFNEGFQGGDIFWYVPGPAPDSIWDFSPGGGFVIRPEAVAGTYTTTTGDYLGDGHDDILWLGDGFSLWDYSPVSGPERVRKIIYDFLALSATAGPGLAGATVAAGDVAVPASAAAASG